MYTFNNVLLDGDALIFRAACVVESTQFNVVDVEGKEVVVYKAQKDAKDYVAKSTRDDLQIIKSKTALPEHVVFKIMDNLISEVLTELDCSEYTVYVGAPSGTKTFRHRLAKTAPYKGNRKKEDRPIHLEAAREYLIKQYNAVIAVDEEADDLLGIAQCRPNSNSIMAGVDKDLMMIPGWHYNLTTKEQVYATDPGELTLKSTKSGKKLVGHGIIWLFAQALMGDVCDNIVKPEKGMGDVKVHTLLTNPKICTILDAYLVVKEVYDRNGRDIEENLDLLFITREVGKNWRELL